VDLEPVYGFRIDEEYPLNMDEARSRARTEAAFFFGAMIYGWTFHYDVGERARGIEEKLELTPQGTVSGDDPNIEFTDVEIREMRVYLWPDYRPSDSQRRWLSTWREDMVRSAQAYGQGPLDKKYAALEDAARSAIRAVLRGGERNRPKEVFGSISLAAFPRFWLNKGQWSASARFYIKVKKIIPFAAY
jgi:hypothetical protein